MIALEHMLARDEGKTPEFKENSNSIQRIVQTAIAFANTAGGVILVGIKDTTKEVVGLADIIEDELRIANAIADTVSPLLVPSFQLSSWRHRDVLIVTIPHNPGPYFLKSKGEQEGTFIRFGSTNRPADAHILAEIKRLKDHIAFDQLPDYKHTSDDLDFDLIKRMVEHTGKPFTKGTAKSLELVIDHQSAQYPSRWSAVVWEKSRGTFS
jgi:ATP-dependent DNA helicase RecG